MQGLRESKTILLRRLGIALALGKPWSRLYGGGVVVPGRKTASEANLSPNMHDELSTIELACRQKVELLAVLRSHPFVYGLVRVFLNLSMLSCANSDQFLNKTQLAHCCSWNRHAWHSEECGKRCLRNILRSRIL